MISLNNTQDFEKYYGWNVVSQTPIQQNGNTYYEIEFQSPWGYGNCVMESQQSVEEYLISLIEKSKPIEELYQLAVVINNKVTKNNIQIKLDRNITFVAYTLLENGSISLKFGYSLHVLFIYLVFELTNVTSIDALRELNNPKVVNNLEKEEYVKTLESLEFDGMQKCMTLFRQAIENSGWSPQLCNGIKVLCDAEVKYGPHARFNWEEIKNSAHANFYRRQYELLKKLSHQVLGRESSQLHPSSVEKEAPSLT